MLYCLHNDDQSKAAVRGFLLVLVLDKLGDFREKTTSDTRDGH